MLQNKYGSFKRHTFKTYNLSQPQSHCLNVDFSFGPITSQSPARASPSSAATTSAPATTHLPGRITFAIFWSFLFLYNERWMSLFLDLGTCCSEGQRHLYCRPKGLVEKPHGETSKRKDWKRSFRDTSVLNFTKFT